MTENATREGMGWRRRGRKTRNRNTTTMKLATGRMNHDCIGRGKRGVGGGEKI